MTTLAIAEVKESLYKAMNDASFYCEKGSEWGSWGVKIGADFLSTSIDDMIKPIVKKWDKEKPEVKKSLNTIWTQIHNSVTTKDDSAVTAAQKVAFALLISLPVAMFFKDYLSSKHESSKVTLPSSFSVVGCTTHIVKSFLYVYIMSEAIKLAANYIDPTLGEKTNG